MLVARGDADPLVADRDSDVLRVHLTDNSDFAPFGRVLDGVADQVVEYLRQAAFVTDDGREVGRKRYLDGVLPRLRGKLARHGRGQLRQTNLVADL